MHDILCSDAPEGHDVNEDEFNEQDMGTKDTLSFCWRALKESRSVETSIKYPYSHVLTSQSIDACNSHEHRLHSSINPRE